MYDIQQLYPYVCIKHTDGVSACCKARILYLFLGANLKTMEKTCQSLSLLLLFFCSIYTKQVCAQGRITTVAGTNTSGFSGDGSAANAAKLNMPIAVTADSNGNLYIVDQGNQVIRKVAAGTAIITTFAGHAGATGSGGDGGPATAAYFNNPWGIFAHKSGNIYIADAGNNRIRKINLATGIISTVAGAYSGGGFSGDGGPATDANLLTPRGVWVDDAGNIFIADYNNNRVRRVNAVTGIINTIAGSGLWGYAGDGGPATAARFDHPLEVGVDNAGNIYISDRNNLRVRKVSAATGSISLFAGTGAWLCSGSGGPATAAANLSPYGIAFDASGNVYLCEGLLGGVKKVNTTTGIINDYVATCWCVEGNQGDDGPATNAAVGEPRGICTDRMGNLYMTDIENHTVRKITEYITMFSGGNNRSLSTCINTTAYIDSFLRIVDPAVGLTERWTLTAMPYHGTVTGFPRSATSTGGSIAPTGFSYIPALGYTGPDSFKVQISDGHDSTVATIRITVDPIPVAGTVTGPVSICPGMLLPYADATGTPGGVWSSANTAIVDITPTGTVMGIGSGHTNIRYTITNSCGSAMAALAVTVNAIPDFPYGATTICADNTVLWTDTTPGGMWSSSTPAVATVNAATGMVTAVVPGTAVITYSLPGACALWNYLTVTAPVPPIGGPYSICDETTITLTHPTPGGNWSIPPGAVATIDATSGIFSVYNPGTTTVSYTVAYGCSATLSVTVNENPSIIGGSPVICENSWGGLVNTVPGGIWSSSNTAVAPIDPTGVYTGIAAGSSLISYILPTGCYATTIVTVNQNPGEITGSSSVCVANVIELGNSVPGGTWLTTSPAVAVINSTGEVMGLSTGTTIITYRLPLTGCFSTTTITVSECTAGVSGTTNNDTISINPNPATGSVTVTATTPFRKVSLTNILGQVVYSETEIALQTTIDLSAMPAGIYLVKIDNYVARLVKR